MLKVTNPLARSVDRINAVFASFEDEIEQLNLGIVEVNEADKSLEIQVKKLEDQRIAVQMKRAQAISLKSRLQELLGS